MSGRSLIKLRMDQYKTKLKIQHFLSNFSFQLFPLIKVDNYEYFTTPGKTNVISTLRLFITDEMQNIFYLIAENSWLIKCP